MNYVCTYTEYIISNPVLPQLLKIYFICISLIDVEQEQSTILNAAINKLPITHSWL